MATVDGQTGGKKQFVVVSCSIIRSILCSTFRSILRSIFEYTLVSNFNTCFSIFVYVQQRHFSGTWSVYVVMIMMIGDNDNDGRW